MTNTPFPTSSQPSTSSRRSSTNAYPFSQVIPAFPDAPQEKFTQGLSPYQQTLPDYPHGRTSSLPAQSPFQAPAPVKVPAAFQTSPQTSPQTTSDQTSLEPSSAPKSSPSAPSHTDQDLQETLAPLLEKIKSPAGSSALSSGSNLEPMLRNIIRRTLAEQLPSKNQSSGFSRLSWRFEALMTSKSLQDVTFSKTRRYRIVETYLFERQDQILLSYASRNPTRHAQINKVKSTYESLRRLIKDLPANDHKPYAMPDQCFAVIRQSSDTILIAISQGMPSSSAYIDLDYLHATVNAAFVPNRNNVDLLKFLQPTLENTLFIQSPPLPS